MDRALQLEDDGKIVEAVEELRVGLSSNPEPELRAELMYHMGRMFLSDRVTPSGRLARWALDNALRIGTLRGEMRESAERLLATARDLEKRQQSAELEKQAAIQRVLEGALELEAAGKVDEALEELSRAIKPADSDGNSQVFFHIGRLQLQQGRGLEATVGFQEALAEGLRETRSTLSGEMLETAKRLLPVARELEKQQRPARVRELEKRQAERAAASTGGPAATTGCQETLGYLSSRLPPIEDPELGNLRNTILNTRISDVAASITSQGIPLAQAASLILQQARENEKTREGSKACAVEAFDGNGADLASALDRRQFDLLLTTRSGGNMTIRQMATGSGPSNVFRSCLRAFIAADMSKIATDETAVQLTCRASRQP